jgi:hypothetical protein
MHMKYKILLAGWLAALSANSAHADTYSGQISALQVSDTGSMDFRVILNTSMPNCNLNFAFAEHSSALYASFVAELTTAYSTGKIVYLQVNREASGFCRISFTQLGS